MQLVNLRTWSTPLIIGAGLYVAVSGVLMFFGMHDPVKSAHEWLGLLFAAAILLHLLTHWRSFRKYFSQKMAVGIVGVILVIASAMMVSFSSGPKGGNPIRMVLRTVEAAPLSTVAPLFRQSPEQLVARLQAQGIQVSGNDQSVLQIARANGKSPYEVLPVLVQGSEDQPADQTRGH